MQAIGAVGDPGQRVAHDGMNPVPVDFRHGVHPDAQVGQVFPLPILEAPDPHQRNVLRVDLGAGSSHARELLRPEAEEGGQRHAVDIAGRRGLGDVDVAVGVDPEHAELFLLLAAVRRDAGNRPDGDRVIPTQHQGKSPALKDPLDRLGEQAGGPGDLPEVSGMSAPDGDLFHVLDVEVAAVEDAVTPGGEGGCDACDPERGWTHVHATPTGTEVHRNAKEFDIHPTTLPTTARGRNVGKPLTAASLRPLPPSAAAGCSSRATPAGARARSCR